MSNDESPPRTSPLSFPPPGYFSCKRRIQILKRYQNIIRHRERWAPEMRFATPLERDIPAITNADPLHRRMLIDREVSRLAVAVHHMLHEVGVPTRITRTVRDLNLSGEGQRQFREEQNDIISDYFDLQSDENHQHIFELIIRTLEEGIGVYEMRKERAFWELFNPLFWAAMLVRAPVWILQRAGLAGDEQMRSLILGIYGKLMYVLLLLGLAFLVVRQGILTWKEVVRLFLKHAP